MPGGVGMILPADSTWIHFHCGISVRAGQCDMSRRLRLSGMSAKYQGLLLVTHLSSISTGIRTPITDDASIMIAAHGISYSLFDSSKVE